MFGCPHPHAVRVVIQDSQAMLALDEFGVSENLVEHLRAESDVAHGAKPVTCLDHCDATPFSCDRLEELACRSADMFG